MAVVMQNCPGWDLCSNLWVCVPVRAEIPGAGNAVNLCVPTRFVVLGWCCWNSLLRSSGQAVPVEGQQAAFPCRTARAVFVLSETCSAPSHTGRVVGAPVVGWRLGAQVLLRCAGSCGGCRGHYSMASSQRDPNTCSLLSFAGMEGCRYSWEWQDTSTALWG